jgi:hypothetical protein
LSSRPPLVSQIYTRRTTLLVARTLWAISPKFLLAAPAKALSWNRKAPILARDCSHAR